jgi:type III secretion protein U
MGEKTEKATPKKLRDARKKGQIAKSQDLPSVFTFLASVSVVLVTSQVMYHELGKFMMNTFANINNHNLGTTITNSFFEAISVIFTVSIPSLFFVSLVGVLITFLTVGPVFAVEVFKFDIKKFNPVDNLKAKFKMKTVIEILKSMVKIGIAAYIVYQVMYDSIPILVKTVSMPISGALMIFNAFLVEVIVKVGLFFLVIAVADFIYQKRTFAKEMKMEKFEIKQEYKNSEGDPHIKSKRKQIAQEIAYQEGPSAAVQKAQAVVTNPTHLAIVIGYKEEIDAAPYILLMGKDYLAAQIVKLAEKFDVPIMRNIPLAHKLWDEGDIYEFVPEETYEAIAEVLRWVKSLKDEIET